jgi:small redox-active disulfide protein 2
MEGEDEMNIKILGAGCAKCQQVEQIARQVVKELAIDAMVEEITDMKKIMQYPVVTTPGLVVNGELVCSGRIPTKSEVTQFIINAMDKEEQARS